MRETFVKPGGLERIRVRILKAPSGVDHVLEFVRDSAAGSLPHRAGRTIVTVFQPPWIRRQEIEDLRLVALQAPLSLRGANGREKITREEKSSDETARSRRRRQLVDPTAIEQDDAAISIDVGGVGRASCRERVWILV